MSRTPKKVVSALTACGAKVGKFELREFTAGTMLLLEKIQSPLVADELGQKKDLSNIELMRLIFALSRPPSESFRILRGGIDAFDEAVVDFADGIPIAALPAFGDQIKALFSGAISTAPAGEESAKKKGPAVPAQTSR